MSRACPDGRAHHWKIATPDGRKHLPAACKHCGEETVYRAGEVEYTAPPELVSRQFGRPTTFESDPRAAEARMADEVIYGGRRRR